MYELAFCQSFTYLHPTFRQERNQDLVPTGSAPGLVARQKYFWMQTIFLPCLDFQNQEWKLDDPEKRFDAFFSPFSQNVEGQLLSRLKINETWSFTSELDRRTKEETELSLRLSELGHITFASNFAQNSHKIQSDGPVVRTMSGEVINTNKMGHSVSHAAEFNGKSREQIW